MVSMSLRQNASTYLSSSSFCAGVEVGLDGVLGELPVGHLGVRPLEGGVDRGGGGLERLGDLGGRPAQDVAQDEHGALAGRQVLEGGDEREPDRVALGDDDGGVGHRLEPGDLGVRVERVAGLGVGGAEAGRERAARPALEVGQADVGRDPVEPGADRRAALEVGRGLPGAQERLLHEVLGLVEGAAHPVAVREQLALVALGECGEVLELRRGGVPWWCVLSARSAVVTPAVLMGGSSSSVQSASDVDRRRRENSSVGASDSLVNQ